MMEYVSDLFPMIDLFRQQGSTFAADIDVFRDDCCRRGVLVLPY